MCQRCPHQFQFAFYDFGCGEAHSELNFGTSEDWVFFVDLIKKLLQMVLLQLISFLQKNPAENLLKPEAYYKWKCASSGESKAMVILQVLLSHL